MTPRIENFEGKILVGKRSDMSFSQNKTFELWRSFMPRRKEINSIGSELYSIEVYDDENFFDNFDASRKFEKWAAVEVSDFDSVPVEMETIVLPPGLYAVFLHKGMAGEGYKTYEYIFRTWLPSSEYLIDNRPHFAVMGENYKKDDPTSEEEIWIPVKAR